MKTAEDAKDAEEFRVGGCFFELLFPAYTNSKTFAYSASSALFIRSKDKTKPSTWPECWVVEL